MLETTQLNPKTADRDIECFKVVYSDNNKNHVISNVMKYDYVIGELNKKIDVRVDRTVYTDVDGSYFLIVKEGYHSYQSDKEIMISEKQQIWKCVIPSGSLYFEDVYHKQFVSSQIIITERVK